VQNSFVQNETIVSKRENGLNGRTGRPVVQHAYPVRFIRKKVDIDHVGQQRPSSIFTKNGSKIQRKNLFARGDRKKPYHVKG